MGRCANVQTAGNDTCTNTHFVIGSLQLLQHSSTPDLIQVHIENGVTLSAHDYKRGFMSCNTKGVLCNLMCRSRCCATWRISPARCRGRGRKVGISGFNTTRALKCTAVRQEQQEQSRRLHMYITAQTNSQPFTPPSLRDCKPCTTRGTPHSSVCDAGGTDGRHRSTFSGSFLLSHVSDIVLWPLFLLHFMFCLKSAHAHTMLNAFDLQLS